MLERYYLFRKGGAVTMKSPELLTGRTRVLYEMQYGMFSDRSRLPRETELAEMLGISRTQLRDTLSELEREGYITRRHGVGTIINRHVLQVANRMDIEVEFFDMVRRCGYEPAIGHVEGWEDTADQTTAEILGIPVGSRVIRMVRVVTADGEPAIYCEDVLPKALAVRPYAADDMKSMIFKFLRKFCDKEAYMDLTSLHAGAADEKLAHFLNVPVGKPLLNMKEVDYDIEGNIIFCSDQYYTDLIQHTVLRKKL